MVTNNEVSDEDAEASDPAGFFPGDTGTRPKDLPESATMPASGCGDRRAAQRISDDASGTVIQIRGRIRAFADGFEENVTFSIPTGL